MPSLYLLCLQHCPRNRENALFVAKCSTIFKIYILMPLRFTLVNPGQSTSFLHICYKAIIAVEYFFRTWSDSTCNPTSTTMWTSLASGWSIPLSPAWRTTSRSGTSTSPATRGLAILSMYGTARQILYLKSYTEKDSSKWYLYPTVSCNWWEDIFTRYYEGESNE